ncbi:hypothetical protein [Bacillus sp. NPDC077027]|uniref:hypothetical protein n=1 Tax=Bacillus sp. NPDC077027 TaxID=3390548 RepID=UPI003CFE4BBA
MIKTIFSGFMIFYSIFNLALFSYRFTQSGLEGSSEIVIYIILLLSYIPALAVFSYLMFDYMIRFIHIRPVLKNVLVAVLTSTCISIFLKIQLNDLFFTLTSFASALIMSLSLSYMKRKG